MRRRFVLTVAIAVMMALAVPAGATASSDVIIEVTTSFGAPSPFTASGPAVDDGLVCPSGIVVDASGNVAGFSPNGFNFQGIKHFTCEDGSGEFYVNLQARIDFRKGTTFQWNVLSGTGNYVGLRGAGSGVGIPLGPEEILDIYDGGLHIER